MQLKEILDFVDKVDAHFLQKHPDMDKERQSLWRSVKLTEEVGELNEQLMGHYGYVRKEKLEKFSQEHLEHEVADVIISTIMIAKSLDVDLDRALTNKMAIVKERLGIE